MSAPTPVEAQVEAERARGVRTALQLLRDGQPGLATYTLARSVMRQNRIAGGGTVEVQPTCPCPGGCPNGVTHR